MKLSDFDYNLPEELIATAPVSPRDHSRLLVVDRSNGQVQHRHFYDLPTYLKTSDLVVLNNTKVLPARLFVKTKYGGNVEVFLIKRLSPSNWECLVKPGRKIKGETELFFEDGKSCFVARKSEETFEVKLPFSNEAEFQGWLEGVGTIPLPPYIKRESTSTDRQTYQTVFAKNPGSVAAPTAGLHFTESVLNELKSNGVQVEHVTLHVGYGTFAPIQVEDVKSHQMHTEEYSIPPELPQKIDSTKKQGGRVLAVGTTALRTLESMDTHGLAGSTNIFITPGYQVKRVDGLLTNFHVPKSSLFVLVCALLGTERAKEVYNEAISQKYRFFSYGDAMLIL